MAVTADEVHAGVKPLLNEVDVFGITDRGRIRPNNADHFLVASFHRAIKVHASSMPSEGPPVLSPDSRGFLFLVADGVGSMSHAREGSAKVTDAIARYLLEMSEISLQSHPDREHEMLERLRGSLAHAHEQLREYALEVGGGAATTITIFLFLWPRLFVAHAGDSRGYRLRDGVLERMTLDQTMAQVMIDTGSMTKAQAESSKLKNVLLSAAGGVNFDLEVMATDTIRGDRHLLCTDGLTKHVTEDEIRDILGSDRGSERVCRDLLALALARGGEDNITILAGRMRD